MALLAMVMKVVVEGGCQRDGVEANYTDFMALWKDCARRIWRVWGI